MIDFFEGLYDDENEESSEEKREPSFSLWEFSKWLSKQKKVAKEESIQESVENKKKNKLKEEYKNQAKNRIKRKKK